MANTNNPKGFRFVRAENGTGAAPTRTVELGSNVGVKVGDMIYLASGAGARTTTTQASWGIALQEITAVAATRQNVLVIPLAAGLVFQGQFVGTTSITQASYLGTTRKVSGASGSMGISGGTVTGGILRIVALAGYPQGNAWGTYATCEFTVARSQYCGVA